VKARIRLEILYRRGILYARYHSNEHYGGLVIVLEETMME